MRISETQTAAATNALMGWLKECRNDLVAGRPIASNPFYEVALTPEQVTGALKGMEDYIWSEINHAGATHASWQTSRIPDAPPLKASQLRPPKFLEMPYDAQLAVVQGMHRVLDPFRATAEEIEAEDRKAEELAANLARDPHFYDNEHYYD